MFAALYWLYSYDKPGGQGHITELVSPSGKGIGRPVEAPLQGQPAETGNIPEHLSQAFWETATPEHLAEKLKSIQNPNETRPDNGQSMLHLAVLYGKYPEMISQLISFGVDYTLKDRWKNGTSAKPLIHLAARGLDSLPFIREILKYDTDVNAIGHIFYKEVLYKATSLSRAVFHRMPLEGIKLLLEKGADPNSVINDGVTVLILAVIPSEYGPVNPQVIQTLLDSKANVSSKDASGKTAYDYIKENAQIPQTAIFKNLIERLKLIKYTDPV